HAWPAGHRAATHVVRFDTPARLSLSLEPLAAMRALDKAREQVGTMPGSPASEVPPPVDCLRSVPQCARNDHRRAVTPHHPLALGARGLSALLAHVSIPRLAVDEVAAVDRVAQDLPYGA